ncbi:hypothetical protein Gotri_015937, partial [Gossypium trilobum]|nr:hypothetical protein [Gossypium trilobum]
MALLHQTFVNCGEFCIVAFCRSLSYVSVPVWLIILSDQLLIITLVSYYLTNL